VRMPFGRHRGEPLDRLPADYVEWLLTIDLREPLRAHVAQEAARRRGERPSRSAPDPVIAGELVSAGLHVLARRHHPDTGGSHTAMTAVTAAADWLRGQIRSLPC